MEKIVVASSKGGVGKTTVALGMASALAERGKNVLLCDLDFENRCLDLFMGLDKMLLYSIFDVAKGRVSAEKAVIKNNKGLSFVAAPADAIVGRASEYPDCDADKIISPEELISALDSVAEAAKADFVICDTAAGHTVPRAVSGSFANRAIIVASHQPTSQRGALRMASILSEKGVESRLVITAFEFKEAVKSARSGIFEIIDNSEIQLLGAVPYDRELMLSHENGLMMPKGCAAHIAFGNIAGRLCEENVPLFKGIKSIKRKKII